MRKQLMTAASALVLGTSLMLAAGPLLADVIKLTLSGSQEAPPSPPRPQAVERSPPMRTEPLP